MIRKSLLLMVITLLILAGSCWAATPEFRAAWVTAWQSGYLTPAEVEDTVRVAKRANLNALFVQVRKTGDAYYQSNYEPRAKLSDPGFDPLAALIAKAHEEGIEVHAWVNTFRIWGTKGSPSDPRHVANRHPDWLSRTSAGGKIGSEGMYLDPGVPEVQDHTYNVFLDIVKNYDVDGIHFDYVRYAGRTWGYAPAAVARFNKETGNRGKPDPKDPAWCKWRRDQVTAVVRRIYKGVKAIKPKVKVTASVIARGPCSGDFSGTEPYAYLFQNWEAWTREGILDALVPMNYGHNAQFTGWLDGMKRWRGDRHAYTGVQVESDVGLAVKEIREARAHGIGGVSCFSFNQGSAREKLAGVLREQVFQEAAPAMGWLEQ